MPRNWSRQSCPGGAYYVCQNGFKGCCSIDPCSPGASCPDDSSARSSGVKTTTPASTSSTSKRTPHVSASSQPAVTTVRAVLPTTTTNVPITTPVSSSTSETAPRVERTSIAIERAVTTVPDLVCPDANDTAYTESNKNSYRIYCSQDNNATSFRTVTIDEGGFTSCFGACDNVTACAGFTYVGLDGGSCYLKRSMPTALLTQMGGDNYISVVRINKVDVPLSASSSSPGSTSSKTSSTASSKVSAAESSSTSSSAASTASSGTKSPTAAIAGGVVGGVVALVLILLIIALLVRRRRRKVDNDRRATKSGPFTGPMEGSSKGLDSPKSGLFAPFGGFHRGIIARTETDTSHKSAELPVENDGKGFYAPEKAPPLPVQNAGLAQLDGTPVYSSSVREPPSQFVEMDDTSAQAVRNKTWASSSSPTTNESPVLGRNSESHVAPNNTSRRPHMMSWTDYDDIKSISPPSTLASGMSPVAVSPPDAGFGQSNPQYYTPQGMRGPEQAYQYQSNKF